MCYIMFCPKNILCSPIMHCEHRRKIIIIVAFSLDVGANFESIPWFSVELKITLYKDVFHYMNINSKI